jgi:hypothetical protein
MLIVSLPKSYLAALLVSCAANHTRPGASVFGYSLWGACPCSPLPGAEPARGELQIGPQLTVEVRPRIQDCNGQVAELLYQIAWVGDGLQVLS